MKFETLEAAQAAHDKLEGKVGELESTVARVNSEAADRRRELKRFEGIDPDEVKTMSTRLKELETGQLTTKGQWDELKGRMEKEHATIVAQKDGKISDLTGRLEKVTIDQALTAAFAKHNAVAPEEAAALVRSNLGMDEHGAFVKDAAGQPLIKDGARVTIDDFTKDWLGARPHHQRSGPRGTGSEGGAGKDGLKEGAVTMKRSEFDALSPQDQAAKAKDLREGKLVVVNE